MMPSRPERLSVFAVKNFNHKGAQRMHKVSQIIRNFAFDHYNEISHQGATTTVVTGLDLKH